MSVGAAKRTATSAKARRAVAAALLLLALATQSASVVAESHFAATPAGGSTARATLVFKIVIPSILFVDSRTGLVYSNDSRMGAQWGRLDVADGAQGVAAADSATYVARPAPRRDGGAAAMRPGDAPRARPVTRLVPCAAAGATPAGHAPVYCLP